MPAPQVDSKPIAEAIGQLGNALAAVAQQQTAILRAISEQNAVLREIAAKNPDIKVPAPTVKMAPRPRSFRVDLEKEGGETVAMQITAESPN